MAECGVIYAGKKYPQFHGARCFRDAPHEGLRHMDVIENTPLQWWTPDEKEAIRQRNSREGANAIRQPREKNGNRP